MEVFLFMVFFNECVSVCVCICVCLLPLEARRLYSWSWSFLSLQCSPRVLGTKLRSSIGAMNALNHLVFSLAPHHIHLTQHPKYLNLWQCATILDSIFLYIATEYKKYDVLKN